MPSGGALSEEVHYASETDDESSTGDIDGVLELDEIYCFDQTRVAELACRGAGLQELMDAVAADMAGSLECFLTRDQAQRASESGDGTLAHVGLKVTGAQQCPHCSQRFDTRQQLQLHDKFTHEALRQPHEALLHRAVAAARRQHRRSIVTAVRVPSPAISSPCSTATPAVARVQRAVFAARRLSMLPAAFAPQAEVETSEGMAAPAGSRAASPMVAKLAKSKRRLSMP